MKKLLQRTWLAGLAAACLGAPALRAEITSWEPLAPAPGTPMNVDTTKSMMFAPQLATLTKSDLTEKLYAVWAEHGGADSWTGQVRIAVYQDEILDWKQIDDRVNGTTRASTLGINYDPKADAMFPHLVVHNGSLYATWQENVPAKGGRTISRIRVSRYNPDDAMPSWRFIDGNAIGGLNLNASENAISPRAVSYGSHLVVTWAETATINRKARAQQVRARAFDGSQWTWLDSGSAAGLNVDPTKWAQPALPVVINVNGQPKLYVSFREPSSTGINQLRVKEHQSVRSWNVVDGGNGLNLDRNRQATSQFSGTDGASIYCVWSEVDAEGVEQIRASRYDGINAWQRLDGGDPTQGLNYQNPLAYGRPRGVQSFNGKIYVHWMEEWRNEAGITQNTHRVAVWDEALLAQPTPQWPWAWADGGEDRSNVEFNAPYSYTYSMTFGVYKGNLLLFNQQQFPYPQPQLGYVLVGIEATAP